MASVKTTTVLFSHGDDGHGDSGQATMSLKIKTNQLEDYKSKNQMK